MNREVIQHGQNGLLAHSDEEWYAALRMLAGDQDRRASLGRAGRATVERAYSAQTAADAFARAVRQAVA
jgi:glycosyltransferase involved in cell wall biosynthesis